MLSPSDYALRKKPVEPTTEQTALGHTQSVFSPSSSSSSSTHTTDEKNNVSNENQQFNFPKFLPLFNSKNNSSTLKKAYVAENPDPATLATINDYKKLIKCNIPYMIQILDVVNVVDGFCVIAQCFVTENLRHVIQSQKGALFDEYSVVSGLLQLSFALDYLHKSEIFHREIKCENVFIKSSERYRCFKLGDFGLNKRKRKETLPELDRDDAITVAPELWTETDSDFSSKTDMWSLGVVLYEFACCKCPGISCPNYAEPVYETILKRWLDRRIPDIYSEYLSNLVSKLVSNDPKERPSAEQIIEDYHFKTELEIVRKLHLEETSEISTSSVGQAVVGGAASSASMEVTAVSPPGRYAEISSSGRSSELPTKPSTEAVLEAKSSTSSDKNKGLSEEKRIGIQNQLILILHSHKCAKRDAIAASFAAHVRGNDATNKGSYSDSGIGSSVSEKSDSGPDKVAELSSDDKPAPVELNRCKVAYCQRMKDVIAHLRTCKNEKACTYRSCVSTRQIILHWQTCTDSECPVCKDVRMLSTLSKPLFDVAKPQPTSSSFSDSGVGSMDTSSDTAASASSDSNGATKAVVMRSTRLYTPLPVKPTSPWQSTFDIPTRQSVIEKFAKDLMTNGMYNEIERVWQFSQQAEAEIFLKSSSRDRYYFLLAERLYTAQKELLHTGGNAESSTSLDIPEQCPICFLEVVKLGCSTRRLKCKHVFHMTCINRWLREHRTCPVCRTDV